MNLDRVIAVRNDKTVYRDGDLCVKVFRENYSKADVLNEALNQARIEETGLPIPRILEVTMTGGCWAIVSEYVAGKTVSRLIAERPEEKDALLSELALLQTRVNAASCPLLTRYRDKLRRKIEQADLPATARFALHVRLEGMPVKNRVCHGDFCPSNVIIRENGEPCILDWSHATQGDPAADAATAYLHFAVNGGEEDARAYLAHYCAASGIPEAEVRRWMPIAAAGVSARADARWKARLLSLAEGGEGETEAAEEAKETKETKEEGEAK